MMKEKSTRRSSRMTTRTRNRRRLLQLQGLGTMTLLTTAFSSFVLMSLLMMAPSSISGFISSPSPLPPHHQPLSSTSRRRTLLLSSSSSALFFSPKSSSSSDNNNAASSASTAAAASTLSSSSGAAEVTVTTPSEAAALSGASSSSPQKNRVSVTPQQKVSTELPIYQLALAGSITTFVADFTMHPVDCLKTLQQSDLGMDWNVLQTADYIFDQFGLAGFFHGFLTYGLADAVGGALKFTVWELWKKHAVHFPVPTLSPLEQEPETVDLTWLGPALAFVASSIIIVPGEFLKQQLQMAHYSGVGAALQSVYATSGLPGFFAGYDGVLLRDIPYTMLELGLYEVFKNVIIDSSKRSSENGNTGVEQEDESSSVVDQVLAAAMTGAVVAIATTPMDVIKTKLMVDAYVNYADCLTTTIQNHGLLSLYSGGIARIAWIVPFTAIYLPTYDFLKRTLLERHLEHEEQRTTTTRT